ncbi:OLC1v1021304C1 [Oldenlandia corymbosa var. corymbosa]|uniref:OLC1v1021304C1 n=1 Tax=Oldenlandia corymbosa var. corymbosa TaxID=529605 RepID=A0AAV1BXL7_OLDCO|nr:OLC1v1021304C1 [Oldenlandia corymbosa var. corymbosa]
MKGSIHDSGLCILVFFLIAFTTLTSCLPTTTDHDQFYSIIANTNDLDLEDQRVVHQLFQEWKVYHGKVYEDSLESESRFRVFRENLKYVMKKNSARKSARQHFLGLNKFADLTNQEFVNKYTSKIKNVRRQPRKKTMGISCKTPSFLDWRKRGVVTGVKDQGQCGSCWAFSSTGAMEGANAIATGDLISLSEQELVDCDATNDGCDGGSMDYAFEWVITNGGIDTESNYPYIGSDGTCNATKEERKIVSIDDYTDVAEDDNALLCAVIKQPVSVGIDGSAIDFQLYTGGIYDGECSNNPNDIDHAVLIVGYGSEGGEDYWIVKNSWGTSWGMEGYVYIRRKSDLEYGVCAINAMASYPIKSGGSSAPPPNPPPSPPVYPSPPPPPSPPSPPSGDCGQYSYCASDETCCCLVQFSGLCLVQGCCEYENGVCCNGTDYCCPSDYPICDVHDGLCLMNVGDLLGVVAKKRKMAKYKFPSNKFNEAKQDIQPSQRKQNQLASSS